MPRNETQLSEIHLHIDDQGPTSAAPPIVLTHGWADTSEAFAGVQADLAQDHRTITWDLRGHGASDAPPPGNYERSDALGDLKRIVDQAGSPCVLGGHSLGGYLSLAHALQQPEDVAALLLVAAGPGFRNPESREQWNDSVRASAAKMELPEGQERISMHTDAWVMDSLSDIKVPTLVIVGERDKRFQASAAVFEKNLDVRQTVLVPDAGHAVHRKFPAEVAGSIRHFLAGL